MRAGRTKTKAAIAEFGSVPTAMDATNSAISSPLEAEKWAKW